MFVKKSCLDEMWVFLEKWSFGGRSDALALKCPAVMRRGDAIDEKMDCVDLDDNCDDGDDKTSYLSQISQILFVEKNLSCGEISDFCKEFEQFMEFYRNLCRVEKK